MGHDKRFVVLECDGSRREVAKGDTLEEVKRQLDQKLGTVGGHPLSFDDSGLLGGFDE